MDMATALRNDRCCLITSPLHRNPRLMFCHCMAYDLPNTSGLQVSARKTGASARAQRSFTVQPKYKFSCYVGATCGDGNTGGGFSGGRKGGGGDGHPGDGHDFHFGDQSPRFSSSLSRAVLGVLALTVAAATFPEPSKAGPGSLSISPNTAVLGGSFKDSPLSASAPTRGGSLADSLDRLSFDPNRDGRGSSSGCSPSRPRSKVLHVSCKGGTLVVPLPAGGDAKAGSTAVALPRVAMWQRKRVVEAPIELSEREARMLASRQNRVRDSLLVQ